MAGFQVSHGLEPQLACFGVSCCSDFRVDHEGDVVTHVGETPVKSVDEFQKAVNGLGGAQGCVMKVKTAEGVRFCVIRP